MQSAFSTLVPSRRPAKTPPAGLQLFRIHPWNHPKCMSNIIRTPEGKNPTGEKKPGNLGGKNRAESNQRIKSPNAGHIPEIMIKNGCKRSAECTKKCSERPMSFFTICFCFFLPQVVTTMDDNESSIDKNSLYHEPFNVNMYTSTASACPMQRQHVTPDYTGQCTVVQQFCGSSPQVKWPFSFIFLQTRTILRIRVSKEQWMYPKKQVLIGNPEVNKSNWKPHQKIPSTSTHYAGAWT